MATMTQIRLKSLAVCQHS